MGIYEKNIEEFKRKTIYSHLYEYYRDTFEENKRYEYYVEKTANDECIFSIKNNNHIYYLNSRYSNEEYVDNWLDGIDNINYKAVFIIFGASNFQAVGKLLNKISDTNMILVYEPDLSVFRLVMENIDISEIIDDDRIVLAVNGINNKIIQEFLITYVSYSNVKYLYNKIMCNYLLLYKDECIKVQDYLAAFKDNCIISRNTLISYASEKAENSIGNYKDFVSQYSLNQIRDKFIQNEISEEIPAILVSAGPSLDKNISELKRAEGKAFIFAVDTALKSLLSNGIKPDMLITVDGHKDTMLFAHSQFTDIDIIMTPSSNYKNKSFFKKRHFYFSDGSLFFDSLYMREKNDVLLRLETGGSVANNGFSAIKTLGFKKIILVGQDLAYPNKKMHADAAYGVGENNDASMKALFEVEDIYGNKVLTEYNMNCYRKWFEQQIIRYPELEVIDATEGGAKICGTKIMKLSDAIDEYCKSEVSIKKIIDEIEPLFAEEDRERLIQEIYQLPEKYVEINKSIDKGIKNYERMDMLNRKGKITGSEFKKVVEEIGKLSEELLNSPEVDLASIFNQKEEYEVLGEVFDCKENAYDDIKDVVKSGIKMMESYRQAIDKILEKTKYVLEVSIERIRDEKEEADKSITELSQACCEENISDINVRLKEFYNKMAKLITDMEVCEDFEKINLDEQKKELSKIIEKVELYTENSDYCELSNEIKYYKLMDI